MTAGVEALSMIILFLWVEIVSWIHHGLNDRGFTLFLIE